MDFLVAMGLISGCQAVFLASPFQASASSYITLSTPGWWGANHRECRGQTNHTLLCSFHWGWNKHIRDKRSNFFLKGDTKPWKSWIVSGRTLGRGCCQKSSGQKSYQHVWGSQLWQRVVPFSRTSNGKRFGKWLLLWNELWYWCYAMVWYDILKGC